MATGPNPDYKGTHYCNECGESVYWDGVDEWLHSEPADDHTPEPEQDDDERDGTG